MAPHALYFIVNRDAGYAALPKIYIIILLLRIKLEEAK